jgi:hypothetical protein
MKAIFEPNYAIFSIVLLRFLNWLVEHKEGWNGGGGYASPFVACGSHVGTEGNVRIQRGGGTREREMKCMICNSTSTAENEHQQ